MIKYNDIYYSAVESVFTVEAHSNVKAATSLSVMARL